MDDDVWRRFRAPPLAQYIPALEREELTPALLRSMRADILADALSELGIRGDHAAALRTALRDADGASASGAPAAGPGSATPAAGEDAATDRAQRRVQDLFEEELRHAADPTEAARRSKSTASWSIYCATLVLSAANAGHQTRFPERTK